MQKYEEHTYFFATVTHGLEPVLADEIKELGIVLRAMTLERGKVIFQAFGEVSRLQKLRCADNLYSIVAEFPIGTQKSDLAKLRSSIERLNWERLAKGFSKIPRDIGVSASRRGSHTFSRFDMMQTIKDVLEERGVATSRSNTDALWIRADVFYDPFCGSGTIPEERALFPVRKILASDYKQEVIWTAEQNCEGKAIVFQSDARHTPSRSESIDCIITNPPWNRQIAVEDLRHLYTDFLAEAKRILKPSGKMFVLTDGHEELTMAARENGLYQNAVCELSL